uniref:(northern house mosquito) hypothetical protein n=1 Tax=Culex pipiens TaxID=7175 RepID=A0A8D8P117_CULPI
MRAAIMCQVPTSRTRTTKTSPRVKRKEPGNGEVRTSTGNVQYAARDSPQNTTWRGTLKRTTTTPGASSAISSSPPRLTKSTASTCSWNIPECRCNRTRRQNPLIIRWSRNSSKVFNKKKFPASCAMPNLNRSQSCGTTYELIPIPARSSTQASRQRRSSLRMVTSRTITSTSWFSKSTTGMSNASTRSSNPPAKNSP